MTRPRFVSIAAVAIPNPRYRPPDRRHLVIVLTGTDRQGRVWQRWPDDEEWGEVRAGFSDSKPTGETKVKPRKRRRA